ncbi:GNAT family N-acetyltransferase [Marispirochaeta aestuarii]|uniref:GNAT family N-acetyltransferase n=1 Tax=Marispirochaeta aestuarii TaxID=1963862 RepID=UPI0029C7D6E1|nr:GNAT family N-acetyltransferase [Marispirochaeta aestuarii]
MERKATIDDIDSIYDIYMDEYNNPYMTFEIMDKVSFIPVYKDILASNDIYVYEIDGKIASTYRIQNKQFRISHISYFGSFAMHPNFRGKGYGKKIMDSIIKRLQTEGKKRIELFVVSDNKRAIRFYQKFGFVQEGIMKYFLKRENSPEYLDELIMAKYL